MRSALRDITHMAAIPILADPDRGWEDESRKGHRIAAARKGRTRREYEAQLAALSDDLKPYLLDRQHDAYIQAFRREGDRFTITAHDQDAAMLVDWGLGRDYKTEGLPFDLVFAGVSYVGWRRVLEDGGLAAASEPRDVTQWLFDGFVDLEGPGVRWALNYWTWGSTRRDGSHLLLVEAKSVWVVERQRQEWLERFGEEGLDSFDLYQAVRRDVSIARNPERLQDLGIAWPRRGTTR